VKKNPIFERRVEKVATSFEELKQCAVYSNQVQKRTTKEKRR